MNGELHKPLPWIIRRGTTEYDPLIFRFGNASSPTSTKAACNEKREGQVLASPRSLITAPPGCGCVARAPSQNRRNHVLRLLWLVRDGNEGRSEVTLAQGRFACRFAWDLMYVCVHNLSWKMVVSRRCSFVSFAVYMHKLIALRIV